MCLSCDCVSISNSWYAAVVFELNTIESSIAYEILTEGSRSMGGYHTDNENILVFSK